MSLNRRMEPVTTEAEGIPVEKRMESRSGDGEGHAPSEGDSLGEAATRGGASASGGGTGGGAALPTQACRITHTHDDSTGSHESMHTQRRGITSPSARMTHCARGESEGRERGRTSGAPLTVRENMETGGVLKNWGLPWTLRPSHLRPPPSSSPPPHAAQEASISVAGQIGCQAAVAAGACKFKRGVWGARWGKFPAPLSGKRGVGVPLPDPVPAAPSLRPLAFTHA